MKVNLEKGGAYAGQESTIDIGRAIIFIKRINI